MSIYQFKDNQKIVNTLISYPDWKCQFTQFNDNEYGYPSFINSRLSKINDKYYPKTLITPIESLCYFVDGIDVYNFIVKNSSLNFYSSVSTSDYNQIRFGQTATSSYDHSSSITSLIIKPGQNQEYLYALKNTLDDYKILSSEFAFSSSYFDKSQQTIRLIQIPTLFFGSEIKKGSVELKFLRVVSGSSPSGYDGTKFVSILKDVKQNGELIQQFDSTVENSSSYDNKCAGVVLYKQGVILLTGSWTLTDEDIGYSFLETQPIESSPRWLHFGERVLRVDLQDTQDYYLYFLNFKGTTKTPVRTFFANAQIGDLNYSANSTYVSYGQNPIYGMFSGSLAQPSSNYFAESDRVLINNSYGDPYSDTVFLKSDSAITGSNFTKQTFLSKIVLYDDKKIPIAVVKSAAPIRHREQDSLIMKLTEDM